MSRSILIIDDDSRNIFALQAVLKAKHFTCISTTSAIEGIAIIKQREDVGVVLMDMMMAEMDGYEAISLIRADENISSTPVIAVTAQAMKGDKDKCLEAGADGYISKPINIDQLLILIAQHLEKA